MWTGLAFHVFSTICIEQTDDAPVKFICLSTHFIYATADEILIKFYS